MTAFVRELREHGARRSACGGDHMITLPCLRGLYDGAPFGLVQFDSHSDTLDKFYGRKVTHATTIRRALRGGPDRSARGACRSASAARSGTATTSPARVEAGSA